MKTVVSGDMGVKQEPIVLLLTEKEYYRALDRYEEHKGSETMEDFVIVVDAGIEELEGLDEDGS